MKNPGLISFNAKIEKPDNGQDSAWINIPFSVEEVYGTKGRVKVKATFDGIPYRGSIANMGTGCHIVGVLKSIRKEINKSHGDIVAVTLELDKEERIVEIPTDLQKALAMSKVASELFDTLSFTNKKEYVEWITSAKKEETRTKRLAATIEKLEAGLKNPHQK